MAKIMICCYLLAGCLKKAEDRGEGINPVMKMILYHAPAGSPVASGNGGQGGGVKVFLPPWQLQNIGVFNRLKV